jgi:cobyrinic acid a,c-diamide synthase
VKLFSSSLRKGIAIAGIRGGSGKTLLTIGIIQALIRKGISVSPFKKGPDYIDPAWLTHASGRHCRNLDAYLMPKQKLIETFMKDVSETDIAIVEGNRGLFDGMDIDGTFSFSELVKLLGIPLILILDCSKSSRTLAAIVHGCETFDKKLTVNGVILNNIAGERHKNIITDSINKYCRAPILGFLPRMTLLSLGERHLGLVPVSEHNDPDMIINALGDAVEKNVDMKALIEISGAGIKKRILSPEKISADSDNTIRPGIIKITEQERTLSETESSLRKPCIGVIYDTAFNFYYRENLEALESGGGRLILLNSMKDSDIPDIDGLYIGGGFPETHAKLLNKNFEFRHKLKNLIEKGLPVYAECGGLIYLSEAIIENGKNHQMTGVFPFVFEISDKPVGHGYTLFEVDVENPFYKKGTAVRGHEFRYSRVVNTVEIDKINTVFNMRKGTGIGNGRDGILYKNCLATFSHTHASSENITWMDSLIKLVRDRKSSSN